MRSPAIIGESMSGSPFGTDMVSIATYDSSVCLRTREKSESSSEPDMESIGEKRLSVDISLDKDSGVDSDSDFIAPDQQLIENVVAMVESYFSDENLLKDEFVLKHIRRNKDGFISLKLLSSFRKVKALTKSWKVVAHCVKVASKSLELNEDATKIRRKAPLPSVDGDKYSRTVIAYNFPKGADDITGISKAFSTYGEIALIRILKSGSSSVIPQHLLCKIRENYDLSQTVVATVEYYNKSDADKALKHFEKSLQIKTMAMRAPIVRPHRSSLRWSESSESNERRDYQRNYSRKSISFADNGIDISLDINSRPKKFGRQKSKSYSAPDETKFNTSYASRRRQSAAKLETRNLFQFVPIIRMPFGPDGTNGFKTHRHHRSRTI